MFISTDKKSNEPILVAPATGLDRLLSYRAPSELVEMVAFGKRALVPLGSRVVTGYILGRGGTYQGELRDIIDVLDDEPLFDEGRLEFFRFVSEYYFAPLGEVIRAALPGGINLESKKRVRKKGDGEARSAIEGEIIEMLGSGKSLSLAMITRKIKKPGVFRAVNSLARRGVVSLEDEVDTVRAKRGETTIVSVKEDADLMKIEDDIRRSPKTRAIFDFIKTQDGVHLDTLRSRFGNIGPQLDKLVKAGAVEATTEYRERIIALSDIPNKKVERLTDLQAEAFSQINLAIESGIFSTFLLFGVTGSGKTEVYIQSVKAVLKLGKSALILVPEISLTPQLLNRFIAHFGDGIALLHSGLSEGERLDQWWRIREGRAKVVLGARSAVFAPIDKLGLIVIDEEHDQSYKQTENPRYYARDAAVMLGKITGSVVILGSATPSLESYQNAQNGRYRLITLTERASGLRIMPPVTIVDMREESFRTKNITESLASVIEENHARGGQAILLLNRRGFSSFILCSTCGYTFPCPLCQITLTYHKRSRALLCHYCDHRDFAPDVCSRCKSDRLVFMGAGTEQLEEELGGIVQGIRVLRLDRDTTQKKGSFGKILGAFARRGADVLLGTQMVAKGHDFPHIGLVGVVNADIALNLPDFRSAERMFALLSQVAGRAGRGDIPSRVIIQTYNPEHYAIVATAAHDYPEFARVELDLRKQLLYPPFSRLIAIRIVGTKEDATLKACDEMRLRIEMLKSKMGLDLTILGPVPAPLFRLRGKYRYHLLIKSVRMKDGADLVRALFRDGAARGEGDVKILVDIDPIDML